MQDTTISGGPSPDELRRLLEHLVLMGNLLELGGPRHDHAGVQVSTSEVFSLGLLFELGPQSQGELGARLGLEKSTVSRLVAGMAERGWLTRERQPDDRRLYRVALTETGRDVADRVLTDLREHHAELLTELTPDELAGLQVGLSGLIRALESHLRHRHRPGHRH